MTQKKRSSCGQTSREISFHPKTRLERFLVLSHEDRAEVLLCLSKRIARDLIDQLDPSDLTDVLEHLDPDQSADIIQLLPHKKQKKVLATLARTIRDQVTFLAEFDSQTAAGLMNLDYIQVDECDLLKDVTVQFKAHEKRTGRLPTMLVLRSGKLVGQLPGHALGLGSPTDTVASSLRSIGSIHHNASRQEIVDMFKRGNRSKLVVLNPEGTILGVVYADSLLRFLEDKTTQSLYTFAGINKEESVLDPARTKIRLRYKWLILNLGTAFLAAFIVSLFQDTISKYVLLAVYMPIVAGMGGNAGTQTLAVLVRGITLGQIDLKTALPTIKREMFAGLVNGFIVGALVALIVIIFDGDLLIALILGLAMITNLVVSATFGTIVPLIMKRLGKDPATSATIFITTATDVLGFLFFLGLATLLLP
ncbi:magnesium transporter [Candidatus Uhrbacteria bacterium CG10_big_fil_rev_8_21_14_0_10_48_16]|uniref:Magnesium transporter n=1 Tax=Candidatus Uhrbacteria bacterium CG10_big_fil_rev_8_21_14_0_10_48_16 TaxID=1975038 RepID=A0A2M8LGN7_9BACT|nr:MAG: magnesium transporter [Candidatus Uhrbacteria bacterium CG10_big_fil_rev_8_21_14_0_10_48_16]